MLELPITVGAGAGGDLLAVDAQREIHLIEEASDRMGRDGDIDLLENFRDLFGGLPSPLQAGDGISGGVVLQENFDGLHYFGDFFSTRLRPAPALRTRSTCTSWANSGCRPRATVWGSRSRKSASRRSPPRPQLEGLQTGIETALLLIEQTVEQEDG